MKTLWAGILVLVFVSGCSTGAPSGGKPSSRQDIQSVFEIPADPYQVEVTTDPGQLVEQVIPESGGTIRATAADGSIFTLEVPADAVVVETLIRMTPVSAISGMPFGDGSAYAVQLEPDGLQLINPATLTITPAVEIPVDQQLMFGYQGQGTDLILAAPVVESKEIKLLVDHFSGYGVTKGLLADIEPVRQRIGGSAEARLQSRIAEELSRERQRQLLGSSEGGTAIDFTSYFKEYEEQVVKPRIAAAGESCAAGRLALQTVLGHERQQQLLGVAEDNANSLLDAGLMDTVASVCMKEEYEICRDDHVITNIIPAWLGLERQFQLLGIGEGSPALESAKQYVSKCLRFELQFHSEGIFDDGGGGGYASVVEAKTIVQFNTTDLSMRGEAPLINQSYEFKLEGCSVTSQRGGDTFTVMSLAYDPEPASAGKPQGSVRDFTLNYYPGNTKESATIKCEDQPAYPIPPAPMWSGIFLVLHESEMDMQAGGFVAKDWDIMSGDYLAKKEWVLDDDLGITEVGTLKLYHRPQ